MPSLSSISCTQNLKVLCASAFALLISSQLIQAQQNSTGLARPGTAKVEDKLRPLLPTEIRLQGGMLGARVLVNEQNRLLHVDETDMLDAFEHREKPHQDWQGEHVGKFLHAATLAWQNTQDATLKTKIDRIVIRLLKTQELDGYLGTYPADKRWTSWDVWVHKYDLLGLLTYYQFTHDQAALQACRRIGDLLIRTFGTAPGQRDINKAGEHMGMAPDSVIEPIVLLYRATDDPRYLQFARYIVTNYDAPGGPAILASLEKYKSVRRVANAKAYEMLSNLNGLLELYRATGESRLLNDMQTAWQDVTQNRLYITGSASSFETFQDDFHLPDDQKHNICETCVTVTWEQMNIQLLRLTGDPKYVDQIERSVYNHLLGAQKPTGDDWSYYTPLEGHKPYDNFTTCCHSSGPRGVALLPEIAAMASADGGLAINLYNAGTISTQLPSGDVAITEETNYPFDGEVTLKITPKRNGQRFQLRLRIPAWTTQATLKSSWTKDSKTLMTGAYEIVNRAWKKGDVITLDMALPIRLVPGDHDYAGKAAIMRGPLVLALDSALNSDNPSLKRTTLASANLSELHIHPNSLKAVEGKTMVQGMVGGRLTELTLRPYADAGEDGKSHYEVWIPLPGHAPADSASGSVFAGAKMSISRQGNNSGDIADDDTDTFSVTYNGQKADMDWYALTLTAPVRINRAVFAHGKSFHDGGWFDTSGGKPEIQVQTEPGSQWKTIATLNTYPNTTAIDSAGLKDGQKFEIKFAPVRVVAIRIIGKPACGDNPAQAFSSCAELQAFAPH